jgi:hypothetical protein
MNKHRVTHLYNIAVIIWINIVYLFFYYSCNCYNKIAQRFWRFVKGEIHKFKVSHIKNFVFFYWHRYPLIDNPSFNDFANSLNLITSLKTVNIIQRDVDKSYNQNFK